MKTTIVFLLLAFTLILHAQSDDQQWLIINQIGKIREDHSMNVYPPGNRIERLFTISGASTPDNSIHGARNDLFIIFDDGNHFNSRDQSLTSEFFIGPDTGNLVHNFSNDHEKPITYAYLTNKYEKDDLPKSIEVKTDNSITTNINSLTPTRAPILSANHNVVFGRDITIIVNYDSLRTLYGAEGDMPDFKLSFDGFELATSPGVVTRGADIFDPSAVFEKPTGDFAAGYPLDKVTETDGEFVRLENGREPYRYINLRTTADAVRFAPQNETTPQFNAVFSLSMGKEKPFLSLTEEMLSSFDPNFLRVDSICRAPDSGYHIFYHLEFENTAKISCHDYHAVVHFSKHFDLTCLDTLEWVAGGQICHGDYHIDGDSCTFYFNGCPQLINDEADPKTGQAYVEFRVKVFPGYNVENFNNSIRLTDPTVYFDGVPFKLNEFRDKVYAKQNTIVRIVNSTCKFCGDKDPFDWLKFLLISLAIVAAIVMIISFLRKNRT